MFYRISGTLLEKDPNRVVVESSSGLSFEILISSLSANLLPGLGEKVILYTYLSSSDKGIYLYGFNTLEEKNLFLLLITVSKIGPKTALNIMSNINKDELANSIVSEDWARVSKIPGIGKKTAERIILELKDKIKLSDTLRSSYTNFVGVKGDVLSALVNLGYNFSSAKLAVEKLEEGKEFSMLFKQALDFLLGKK